MRRRVRRHLARVGGAADSSRPAADLRRGRGDDDLQRRLSIQPCPSTGLDRSTEQSILWQIVLDLISLTLILYFSDISRNPFLFYFVFHMIIGSMYLHGRIPYLLAGFATAWWGASCCWCTWVGFPTFPIYYSAGDRRTPSGGLELIGVFGAFATTIWIAVYFTTDPPLRGPGPRRVAAEERRWWASASWWPASPIKSPIRSTACRTACGRSARASRTIRDLTEYVQMMDEALERIETTAKRVQAFARPRGITLQSTDVNEAVEATLQLLGASHRVGIRNRDGIWATCPPVQGDPYTLQEVLFNLLTNAVAAMPDGGTVTITSRVLQTPATDGPGTVAVDVTDTGVGIPAVQLEKIFEPFFTTRAESGGTGLGLGLCRMLISEMGGRIEVAQHASAAGTTFTRDLESKHAEQRRQARAMRILVVDDEKIKRVTLADDLATQGHEVVTAADGEEALRPPAADAGSTWS